MKEYFDFLNHYFDKIYVLSLPRLTERIKYIKHSLQGLNFEFFWGVDKQSTSLEDLKQKNIYSTEQYGLFYKKPVEITLGMLCCSLSHVKIYENIILNGFQKTLILEDDVVPVAEGLHQFNPIIRELPADWELLYLGYEKNESNGIKEKIKQTFYKIFPAHAQLRLTRQIYSRYYPIALSPHIAKAGFHDCTHAYGITLEGAKKLLRGQQPVRFHPDNLLAYMISTGRVNGYIARPKLFNQLSAFVNQVHSLTAG